MSTIFWREFEIFYNGVHVSSKTYKGYPMQQFDTS
jgi:hypothetical protein